MSDHKLVVVGGEKPGPHFFENTEEATEYLSRRLSSSWQIASLIGKTLEVNLVEEQSEEGISIMNLKANGEHVSTLPRRTSDNHNGVGLQTGDMNLIGHVGPRTNHVFDRGLLWVNAFGNTESAMQIHLNAEHGLKPDDLKNEIDIAFDRGDKFVTGLLDGLDNPPYAPDFRSEPTI